ncbi:MAG: P1 family peptidase [Gemmatimonadota bacterium]
MENRSLTAVPGIAVGHATEEADATGCTVILGPFVGAVELAGQATGSRELDVLSPHHLVPSCDAILLTGGSAFGLRAADGVVSWLEERGRGFLTREGRVPIVPAAVIYDLGVGRADARPDAGMGYAAAAAASTAAVREGRVGAGTGASVGKLMGRRGAERGGVGSWACRRAESSHTVGALAVVNAFGDVLDKRGTIVAGCRADDGTYLDTAKALREGAVRPLGYGGAENTTLGVVATDAPLRRTELQVVARHAAGALVRRISPAGTAFDGDLVFALSTGRGEAFEAGPGDLLTLGLRARATLERAIERAVDRQPGGG